MEELAKILGPEWISHKATEYAQADKPMLFELSSLIGFKMARADSSTKNGEVTISRSGTLTSKMAQARFEYIRGASTDVIRNLYRIGATSYLSVLEARTFSRKIFEYDGVTPSTAAKLTKFNPTAQIERHGNYCHVRYEAIDIPSDITFRTEDALHAAIISGDWNLVERITQKYPIPQDVQGPIEYNDLETLAALILGRDRVAIAMLENEPPSYARGYPPKRREFLKGVLTNDLELIKTGLKLTNARFKGMWNINKYKKMWNSQNRWQEQYAAWEDFWNAVKKDLELTNWLMSEYAVSCVCLAAHRGMGDILRDSKLFSDFVPFTLVHS